MATSADKPNEQKCPICFEEFHMPRKLPGCSHSFCETCILTFVSDLKKEDKLGSDFECPVCRLPSQSPGNDDVLQRWIGSLEINKELDRKVLTDSGELQDCSGECCGQCHDLKKTVEATRYCLTCQEFYCSSCSDTVHAFRANRSHTVIDTVNKKAKQLHVQALKMLKGFIMCSEHPEMPVMIYCVDDRRFCCISCSVDKHKNCKNVKHINESRQPVLDSTKLVNLTVNLQKHIAGIITTIKAYDVESKEQLDKIETEFQEMKQKIIRLLDVMEDNLKQEAKAAVKDISIKRQDEMDGFNNMKNTLDTVHYLLKNFLGDMSSTQVFACMHEAEHIMEGIEMKLIRKGENIETESVALTTTDMLKQILNTGPNETSQLASVSRTDANIALPTYEDKPFLRNYELKKTGICKVFPVASKNTSAVTIEQPVYSDIQFLSDDKILLIDSYYGFVCFVNNDFARSAPFFHLSGDLDNLNCFCNERYATLVRDGILAVSIPAHKKIIFVTANENFEARGEIECMHVPKALHGLENGDIAVFWDEPVAFGIISGQVWNTFVKVYHGKGRQQKHTLPYGEKIYFTKDKSGRELKSFYCMAVDEGRHHVIQPCNCDKAVYCFDFDGQPVFQYLSDKLESPTDVSLDGDGNVYISDSALGCVHIISPEGLSVFIITEDLPAQPLAVGFNKSNGTLAVTQFGGEDRGHEKIHLFSVVSKVFQCQ